MSQELIIAAKQVINHWQEFGPESGFDEIVYRLEKALSVTQPAQAAPLTKGEAHEGQEAAKDDPSRDAQVDKLCVRHAAGRVGEASPSLTAQAAQSEPPKWGRVDTVADLVRNLLTLDQSLPMYAGMHADYQGKRVAITRPVSVSRERVRGRFIDPTFKDVQYSVVVWAGEQYEAAQSESVPLGAIENGRVYAERVESQYGFKDEQGHALHMCGEWHEFRRCFEHLAEWVSRTQQAAQGEQEAELRRSLAAAEATISERNAEIINLHKRLKAAQGVGEVVYQVLSISGTWEDADRSEYENHAEQERRVLYTRPAPITAQGAGEPYAYAVYFPDQPTEMLTHDLDDLSDDMTNREHSVTPLFDHPAPTPAQPAPVVPDALRKWHEAYGRYLHWNGEFNRKHAMAEELKVPFPGPDLNREYQAFTSAQNEAHRLQGQLHEAITAMLTATRTPPAQAPFAACKYPSCQAGTDPRCKGPCPQFASTAAQAAQQGEQA